MSVASSRTECSDMNMNFSSPGGHLSLLTEWSVVSQKPWRKEHQSCIYRSDLSARSLTGLWHQRTELQFDALLPFLDGNVQLEARIRFVTQLECAELIADRLCHDLPA